MAEDFLRLSALVKKFDSQQTAEVPMHVARQKFGPALIAKARVLSADVKYMASKILDPVDLVERVFARIAPATDWDADCSTADFARELILALEQEIESIGDSTPSCASDDSIATETFSLREQPAIDRQQEYRLHACIAELPDDVRIAVAMRQIEGAGYATIAESLNVQPAAAAGKCRRGIELLIQCLETRKSDDDTRSLDGNLADTHSRRSGEDDSASDIEVTR